VQARREVMGKLPRTPRPTVAQNIKYTRCAIFEKKKRKNFLGGARENVLPSPAIALDGPGEVGNSVWTTAGI